MKSLLYKISFLLIGMIFLTSCGSSHKVVTTKKERNSESSRVYNSDEKASKSIANDIVKNAKKFEGTRYKYGGTNKHGMDCSGLIYVSFREEGLSLPRTSRAMSLQGKRLYLKEVDTGDLLFFQTNKNRKVINHVGLVVEVTKNEIYFIHSSTSSGVIISSLSQSYWKNNFVMARRVI